MLDRKHDEGRSWLKNIWFISQYFYFYGGENNISGVTKRNAIALTAGAHSYAIAAVDESKNAGYRYSPKSTAASVTVGAGTDANVPTGFSGEVASRSALELTWVTAVDESHGGEAKEYEIYKNNALLLTTNNGSSYWLETGLNAGQPTPSK